MDEVMNSVSVLIQRAIIDAINNQVFPQTQNALMAGSGPLTQKGWNGSTERPERNAQDNPNQQILSRSRNELSVVVFVMRMQTILKTLHFKTQNHGWKKTFWIIKINKQCF